MTEGLHKNFERILAARERLLAVRADRVGMLLHVQSYLRTRLAEFFTNLDPVTGVRLADLLAEGSKAAGEMALQLTMLDGTRMRISVDGLGRFSHESEPNVFEGVGEIVEFRVSPDQYSAEFLYVPNGDERRGAIRASFDPFVDRLIEHTTGFLEAQLAPKALAATPAPPPRIGLAVAEPIRAEVTEVFRTERPEVPYRPEYVASSLALELNA
ncbi:MAG TPA: hypothetical protein VKG44_01575, partial [Candidatus Baltobacteraceae bacterium]|nr:hypothetical protein [Candidatus Baltobacteraceae bacterium]